MKTLFQLVVIVAFVVLAYFSYQDVAEKVDYPVERTITNRDGVTLDTTITGRSDTHVWIIRKTDNLLFDFPIANLSDLDQEFVLSLPVKKIDVPVVVSEPEPEPVVKASGIDGMLRQVVELKQLEALGLLQDPYVTTRMEYIRQLEVQYNRLQLSRNMQGNTTPERHRLDNEMDRLLDKFLEIRKELYTYAEQRKREKRIAENL